MLKNNSPCALACSTESIYHITTAIAWQTAQVQGAYTAPSLSTEGFIHCSYAHQVPETAALYFQEQSGLVLLAIDPARLAAPLKLEPSRKGDIFPHLYGPLNLDAVLQCSPLTTEDRRNFLPQSDAQRFE
jgi:uncharacterized protein (DUF952 family)